MYAGIDPSYILVITNKGPWSTYQTICHIESAKGLGNECNYGRGERTPFEVAVQLRAIPAQLPTAPQVVGGLREDGTE